MLAVSQKRQTVLAKLELPHFIETAFVHSRHCRLLSQVQETLEYLGWTVLEQCCKYNLTTDF